MRSNKVVVSGSEECRSPFSDLVAATNLHAELFASVPDADLAARGKSGKLSRAMDKINHRFGATASLLA
jgi:hypothetical protein